MTTWQAKDGLPQETLTAIAQTTDGAIWIGAPSGLIRFDGTHFRKIPLPTNATPGDHYVTGLLADSENGIWYTTRNNLFYLKNDVFLRWGAEDGLPAGGALGLAKIGPHTLALATEQGVLKFELATRKVVPLHTIETNTASALTIAHGRGARVWAGTMRGLLQMKTLGDTRPASHYFKQGDIVNAILEDSKGRLWIGTSLGIRVVMNGRKLNLAVLKKLKGLWIRCLLEDKDHNIWIGTRGNGSFRFHDGILARFSTADGLSDDLVRQIFEDRAGSLWFVTAGGLSRLRDGAVTSWTVREGLPVPFIWSVYEDQKDNLWVGTSGGGVVRLESGIPFPPPFSDPGLIGVEIRAFLTDRTGDLWIGTSGNGLAHIHDRKVSWYRWSKPTGRNIIYCMLQDHLGRLWIGTGNGLACMSPNGQIQWRQRISNTQPTVIRSLKQDIHGRIWVGTTAGLAWIINGKLVSVPGTERLSKSRVHCIYQDNDHVIWLATDAGLGRFEKGHLELINSTQGLPNEMLYWILPDLHDQFWISSDLGIMRISRKMLNEIHRREKSHLEILVVGRIDGMPSTECNSGHPGGTILSNGNFCFATTNGVAIIDPVRVKAIELPPPVSIEEVLIDGRQAKPESGEKIPVFNIPSGSRRVQIRYGAISLVSAEKLSFRYRLIGFDSTWVKAGKAQEAFFTSLPPGRFQFTLTARHGAGPWATPPAQIILEVTPAFHQTIYFFILVLVCLVLLGWSIVRYRTARLRAKERELRQIVAQRTKEVEAANSELATVNKQLEELAIHDALTGLINRRKFNEALTSECRRCFRNQHCLALLFIDIDHFKKFNDCYGHLAGDECLRAVSRVLSDHARRAFDLAARYGGEEFILLLPETKRHSAAELAESVRNSVEALSISHSDSPTASVLTVSIGWTCIIPKENTEPEALVAEADKFLYEAKKIRNTVSGPY
ncbi:MAG: diguanylate cyclase [Acidobacteria bacterium]|nr:diguanylate cyclase [Acidobacteriota bacterium]